MFCDPKKTYSDQRCLTRHGCFQTPFKQCKLPLDGPPQLLQMVAPQLLLLENNLVAPIVGNFRPIRFTRDVETRISGGGGQKLSRANLPDLGGESGREENQSLNRFRPERLETDFEHS